MTLAQKLMARRVLIGFRGRGPWAWSSYPGVAAHWYWGCERCRRITTRGRNRLGYVSQIPLRCDYCGFWGRWDRWSR